MPAIAYVNGVYGPLRDARVSVQDRAVQFADSVYEVWAVRSGKLIDHAEHLARLSRSCAELSFAPVMSDASLGVVLSELLRRNRVVDGLLYLQITRGQAARDHVFPASGTKPGVIATARSINLRALEARVAAGVAVVTRLDERWARCDIKSTALLANVLARQSAREAGAQEAWLYDADDQITEGAATSAWIVDAEGVLRTRALSNAILPGVTRSGVLREAQALAFDVQERAFSRQELADAREAFMTSASAAVTPVVAVDGRLIGEGAPGPITRALYDAYWSARLSRSTSGGRATTGL